VCWSASGPHPKVCFGVDHFYGAESAEGGSPEAVGFRAAPHRLRPAVICARSNSHAFRLSKQREVDPLPAWRPRSYVAVGDAVPGYALANKGHDTRALQAYLGHKNIQHTVRYIELSPDRFKDFWRD
jgi:integrase-like protein